MLSFHVKFVQTDRRTDEWTDRRTSVKQYAPDLSMLKIVLFGSLQLSSKFYLSLPNNKFSELVQI